MLAALAPFAGPLIGGAASLLGGMFGNQASAKQAALNRQFQLDTSNTSHQRATEDLRKAGLNRILSVTQGGASTPVGSVAQQRDPVTPAVNTFLATARQKEEIETLRETRRGISADSDVKEFMRDYEEERYGMAEAVKDEGGNVVVTPLMKKILREELHARMAAAKAGQEQPGASVNLTKMEALLKKLQAGGQDLTNQEKQMLVQIARRRLPGDVDEAGLWSSTAGDVRRRSDMAAEGVNKWLPWGGLGQAIRGNSARTVNHLHRRVR